MSELLSRTLFITSLIVVPSIIFENIKQSLRQASETTQLTILLFGLGVAILLLILGIIAFVVQSRSKTSKS